MLDGRDEDEDDEVDGGGDGEVGAEEVEMISMVLNK